MWSCVYITSNLSKADQHAPVALVFFVFLHPSRLRPPDLKLLKLGPCSKEPSKRSRTFHFFLPIKKIGPLQIHLPREIQIQRPPRTGPTFKRKPMFPSPRFKYAKQAAAALLPESMEQLKLNEDAASCATTPLQSRSGSANFQDLCVRDDAAAALPSLPSPRRAPSDEHTAELPSETAWWSALYQCRSPMPVSKNSGEGKHRPRSTRSPLTAIAPRGLSRELGAIHATARAARSPPSLVCVE